MKEYAAFDNFYTVSHKGAVKTRLSKILMKIQF